MTARIVVRGMYAAAVLVAVWWGMDMLFWGIKQADYYSGLFLAGWLAYYWGTKDYLLEGRNEAA